MNNQDNHYLIKCLEELIDMLYNIEVKFKDGSVAKFNRESNIKPINSYKLNCKIYHEARELDTRKVKSITSIPVI
jgi:hypothetical protein